MLLLSIHFTAAARNYDQCTHILVSNEFSAESAFPGHQLGPEFDSSAKDFRAGCAGRVVWAESSTCA